MELWDAGTTAFWACVVEPGRPHECTVPRGVELRLKGACVAAGAKRKAAATLTVSAEDDSTTSIVARLSISSDRDCCVLKHVVNSGACVLAVSGTAAVHVTGNIVQMESLPEELTEDNTEGWSFVDPHEVEQQDEPGDSAAESESESDGLEEVIYDTASMDADGGGDSDQDSLDDDTGTVDYSDAEYTDDETNTDSRPDEEEPAASPSKVEREELALDTIPETTVAAAEEGDEDAGANGDADQDKDEADDMDDIFSASARLSQKRKLEAEQDAGDAKKKDSARKKAKKHKPAPVYDMTPGPEPSKSQKTKANKLLKKMKTKASGLQVYDQKVGEGAKPKPGRKLRCHYTVRLGGPTGKLVQHSGSKPYEFRPGLREVISGWDEGVIGMRAGGKRVMLVPPSLGYGKRGVPPMIPPRSTLFFELELL